MRQDASYLACGVYSHNSSDPNLQNIPRGEGVDQRAEDGRRVKELFKASPGCEFLFADYSQLELRVACMLSGDTAMKAIFDSGVDYHLGTARLIAPLFGVAPLLVDKAHWLRSNAKIVNFSLVYGKGDEALASDLGTTVETAGKLRAAILGAAKHLDRWLKGQVVACKRDGGVWTYRNGTVRSRWRPLPNIASRLGGEASNAKNASLNTPVQGTGSEYMLESLIGIDMVLNGWSLNKAQEASGHWEHVRAAVKRYRALRNRAKLNLTVHDMAGLDVKKPAMDEARAMVKDVMEGWESCGVPFPVDFKRGEDWGNAEAWK